MDFIPEDKQKSDDLQLGGETNAAGIVAEKRSMLQTEPITKEKDALSVSYLEKTPTNEKHIEPLEIPQEVAATPATSEPEAPVDFGPTEPEISTDAPTEPTVDIEQLVASKQYFLPIHVLHRQRTIAYAIVAIAVIVTAGAAFLLFGRR